MKLFLPALAVLFLAISATDLDAVDHQALACANQCRYRLCFNSLRPASVIVRPDGAPNKLRGNGIPMGGEFCTTAGSPLYDVSIREALVSPDGRRTYKRISKYRPKGLYSSYPSNYFRVINGERGVQRIGRGIGQGNQGSKLNAHCVTIPLKSFRTSPRGGVTRVNNKKDCISMMVRAFKLTFELQWDNTDDFDLTVTEPGPFGESVSRLNMRSFYGGIFSTDNNVGRCSLTPIPNELSRETVQYSLDGSPPEGRYTVGVKQFNSCGRSNANFIVRVILGDKVILERSGVAPKNSGFSDSYNFNIVPCGFI